MLHTGVVDEADSDLSLGHSGYGNNDLLHDLFLPPNYTAGCSPVIPVRNTCISSVLKKCKVNAVVLNSHDKIVHL